MNLYLFSVRHGFIDESIPVLLNESSVPYCELSMSATVPVGTITTNPRHIILQTVPLGFTLKAEFLVIFEGFARYSISSSIVDC